MARYDITLRGGICGPIWWPADAKCGSSLSVNLSREIDRIVGGKPTLRDVILLVLAEKGGDFQSALLTSDTEICVTAYRTASKRTRYWPITAFASIADCVDQDAFVSDFSGEGE